MNSCLYEATVMHNRLAPLKNSFWYKVFMFYIDLDELDEIVEKNRFISRNKFNIFNFRDQDHLEFPRENPVKGRSVNDNIRTYLAEKGIVPHKIRLLTNLCTLGYQFNPVSFYFCFDREDKPECMVVEIGNTFLEQKPYFIGKDEWQGEAFKQRVTKYFYVSPFTDLLDQLDFNIKVPNEKLDIKIDDYKTDGSRFFVSTLTGKRVELTNKNTLKYAFKFPWITLQVITLIHWQAMKLWFKKLPYHKKAEGEQNQREVYKPYAGNTKRA